VASPQGEVTSRFASYERSECFTAQRAASCLRSKRFISNDDASLTNHTICDILYSTDGDIVATDKLSEQSMDFAVHIINLVKQLKEQRESILGGKGK